MYEYVPKSEYKPVKAELEMIIRRVQKIMEKEHDLQFYYDLIGSGGRHLITRVKGGNKGFDFDYNFIIPTPPDGEKYNAKEIKKWFMIAINKAIKGTSYKCAEDSTSSATIKIVNVAEKCIVTSCDFAIIYYEDEDDDAGYWYVKNYKNGGYGFVFRSNSRNIDSKLDYILEYEQGWNWIREEYLKLKNSNNDPEKHSFVLFIESVHNVYNQMKQIEDSYNRDSGKRDAGGILWL